MDLTIFYWLVINAANIILLYKRDFSKSYLVDAPVAMDINEALDLVKQKYDLTKREVEILKGNIRRQNEYTDCRGTIHF